MTPISRPERAVQLGVEKVELDDLLKRADFITLHVPMTEKTKNILSAEALAKTKKGVRIINCARGGLVDEAALADADQIRPCRRRRLRRVLGRAGGEQSAVRARERRLHAASRRRHQRGAGECRAAGRRADERLSAEGRDHQRGELPLDLGRRSAAHQALRRRWPRSSARSSASSPRRRSRASASSMRARSRA